MTTTLKKIIASIIVLAFLSALPVQASVGIGQSSATTLTNGLVGYWTFDGKDINWNTGQLIDRSGQGNTGQLSGLSTTTSVAIGKVGQALKFNRKTSSAINYAQVPDSTSLAQTGSNSFTTSFWVNPSVLCDGSNQNYLEKAQDSATPGWGLYMQSNCSLNARLAYTAARVDVTASAANVSANFATSTWTHVVFVVDRSANLAQWYFNGKAIGSPTSISSLGDMTNTKPIDIGAGKQGLGIDTIGGLMDDVRVYNRALSAQEIAQLYVAGGGKIAQSQTNTLTNGLVGYWTLDGKDTNWVTGVESDRSNNNNTCAIQRGLSTTTTVTVGKVGQGFSFTGVDTGYLNCGNSTAFQTNQQTLVAWIKTTNAGSNFRSIVAKSLAFGMYLVNNVLGTYDNGASQTRVSSGLLNDGKWHQVAIAFNSGVTNGTFMYVDSVLVASTTVTVTNQGNSMKIGYGQSGGQVFNGQIDDVRVYNRQLSAQEIAQLYTAGGGTIAQSNATLLKTGLVGYWPFDGSSLNWKTGQVADKSGQGNTGALVGLSTTTSVLLGRVGQSLRFSGVSYVRAPVPKNATFTLSLWAKYYTVAGNPGLAQAYAGGGAPDAASQKVIGAWISGSTPGDVWGRLIQSSNVAVNLPVDGTAVIPANTWHLLTYVADGTNFSLYVDGNFKKQVGYDGTIAAMDTLAIGRQGFENFNGAIDDARLYGRALSAQEINQLYASTK